MLKAKNFSFRLSGLWLCYINHISKDIDSTSPTVIIQKIISEYIIMKYGEEVRKDIRREFLDTIY